MSKSELNILRFLQGEATPEEMKKLQKWSAKKPENESDLAAAQEVFNNVSELGAHKLVNVDQEWASFMSNVNTKVSDLEILQYVDGTADYNIRKKVASWGQQNTEQQRDLDISKAINSAIKGIEAHKSSHSTTEYLYHLKKRSSKVLKPIPVAAPAEVPNIPGPSNKASGSVFPMWARYAVAASMTLLVAAFIFLYNPAPTTVTYATAGPHQLDDGSIVTLDANSSVTAFANIDKVDKREVQLKGTGKFDIAQMTDKPFELSSDQSLGISVLGTVFSIESDPEFLSLISTLEGKVEAFDVDNPSVRQVINEGESMGFSEDGFTKVEEEVIPDNRKTYTVLQVLDHLMENSNWKVISSPSYDFKLQSKIHVDLDKPYGEIIEYLSGIGHLTYNTTCKGCYTITSFKGE